MAKYRIVGTIAGLSSLVGGSLALWGGSAVASTKPSTPTCSTVSVAMVRQYLGGKPSKPKSQTSPNVLICQYTTVDLIFLTHQTKAAFAANERSNKGTSVKGIANGAFSYGAKGSRDISLEFLDGTVAVAISGTSVGLPKVETFAKKLVPIV
jgi:hypothetical protein